MAEGIRVIRVRPGHHLTDLGAHIHTLQDEGHVVILVSADRPYRAIANGMPGVSMGDLFVIDAVTCVNGKGIEDRPVNAIFLPSPTMLEMMALRIEQVLARAGPKPVVLVDNLDMLAMYNGNGPVQEFSHYLANRLRTHGVPGDLIVRSNAAGDAILEGVEGFTDSVVNVGTMVTRITHDVPTRQTGS